MKDDPEQGDRSGSETRAAIAGLAAALRRDASAGWARTADARARVGRATADFARRTGAAARRSVSRRPDGSRPRWPIYALAGVAGVTLIAGLFLSILTI